MYIGIDPDVDKSGYAVWNNEERKFAQLSALSFFDVIDDLNLCTDDDTIIIEAGWLNKKSNYHKYNKTAKPGVAILIGQRIAKNVGSNHQIGKLIEEFCKRKGLKYTLCKPTTSKTDKQTFLNITGIQKVKNQDVIDAAMLVYGM